jgi:hypothetical protein
VKNNIIVLVSSQTRNPELGTRNSKHIKHREKEEEAPKLLRYRFLFRLPFLKKKGGVSMT